MTFFTVPNLVTENNRGQALIETFVAIPFLITFIGGMMFCVYVSLVNEWTEHWVYQTNLCLIRGESKWSCQSQLSEKIKLLVPTSNYQIKNLWKTQHQSFVSLEIYFAPEFSKKLLPSFQRTFTSEIDLPLDP